MSPRILLCTDDSAEASLLATSLGEQGYETLTAQRGDAARRTLESDLSVRMVIAGWDLPGINGRQLCTWLRAHRMSVYTYAILLSPSTDEDASLEGFAAGADDLIERPVKPKDLYLKVRSGERLLSMETRDSTIFALAKLAESRDPETGAHLERTRMYCKLLAEDLHRNKTFGREIDAEFVRLMWLTSPLHDIGKVGIPDSVLLKPARLDDREFAVMKTHTTIGAETLQCAIEHAVSVPRFLKLAYDIALSHHERWDGAGYPAGLRADNIPLCARIMAVADVYDALTSKRVYKNAMAHDVARGILIDGADKHFDQRIIDSFVRIQDQFDYIRMGWNDESTPGDTLKLAA
jgi:putative two-component system response regulator